ncbi:valine--tRNA ligase [Magnetococcales bacterium HHB-1]
MSEPSLPKTYNPVGVEERWYTFWEQNALFAPQQQTEKDAYCIMIPPPNVTGTLHMGHAFQDTIMDALTRYHRMKGHSALWQPGTDHAGIATQMVVERQLQKEGKSRHDLGRDAFVDRVWQWKAQSGGTIVQQLRRLGASCDWSNERFTMDEGLSKAVQEVFVRLYKEGLIYRGQRLVNWDPVLHTAVSDLEVLSEEENGHFWHMRYPLSDGSGHLIVATTRPETMLGDTAVAVHPEDERYQHLIGETVTLPLVGRKIPIISDDYVDPEFGTGCVKITPAHDFNDYEIGQRHQLQMINVLTEDAKINQNAPEAFQGLDRFDARKKVVEALEQEGLLEKIEPHRLMVPRGDRTKAIIEPLLTDQWFVKTESLAEASIRVVEEGKIRFVPENWEKTYFEWMRNIQDWCISRQIWWGHRIPAWYGPDGKVFVSHNEAEALQEAEKHYGKKVTLKQDEDVLDTWFSSALWPFSTLGWPEQTESLKKFYPTDVLVTGFDIIFFWVARMIMMGLKFLDDVPFKTVYITGLIMDGEGNKMSKSKGNILDPLDLIDGIQLDALVEKRTKDMMQPHLAKKIAQATRKEFPKGIPAFGTDALRFTMASLATQGRDIKFDLGRIEGYRNFCNKIWNASRFVLMNTEENPPGASIDPKALSMVDRWLLSRLQDVSVRMAEQIEAYRFNDASHIIYQFLWGEFCDWYLELSKAVLFDQKATPAAKQATCWTMAHVLEQSLRLLHPLMPFITEELWQKIAPLTDVKGESLMMASWPEIESQWQNQEAETVIQWVMDFILAVRNIRGEMGLPPGKKLSVLVAAEDSVISRIKQFEPLLKSVARIEDWQRIDLKETPEGAATAILPDVKIFIPLKGLVDLDAELIRLDKALGKVINDLNRAEKKLANPNFVSRAKAEIVAQERERLQLFTHKKEELLQAKTRIERLRG